jgi:REP element-mobilizing transposase RayT
MAEKFQNKYRIASHRRPGWDYSSNGMYFITVVTQNMVCNLGEVVMGDVPAVQLSDFGKIVDAEWHKSFEIRNELFLDKYIIMPNHLHAIVVINNDQIMMGNGDGGDGGGDGGVDNGGDGGGDGGTDNVETHGRASLPQPQLQTLHRLPLQTLHRLPKSISSFFGGFKSAVNSKIDDYIDEHQLNIPKYNRNNHFFQPNYHDHIIRDEQSYHRISNYIINNPAKWCDDKFYRL